MTKNAGVWIDHHKAVIIRLTDQGEEIQEIESERDPPPRFANGGRVRISHSRNDFVAEDKRERKAKIELNAYYDEVIASLHDADAVLVLGPGAAKGEFTERIAGQKRRTHVAYVETVDKMTDRQIAAHVRKHFQSL